MILKIETLQSLPNQGEALQLLNTIATHVMPIMTRNNYKVGILTEFYPNQTNLLGLNVNRGQKICVRLRHHYDKSSFLEFNDLIGTMLHELTHNVFGPHDAKFYKHLDVLFDQYETLSTYEKNGQGFAGKGSVLGGGTSSSTLAHSKLVAFRQAEKRRNLNRFMIPVGGVRLGGSSSNSNSTNNDSLSLKELESLLTPSQMAAMSAERRCADEKWCGGRDDDGDVDNKRKRDVKKVDGSDKRKFGNPVSLDDVVFIGSSSSSKPAEINQPKNTNLKSNYPSNTNMQNTPTTITTWTCNECTFVNLNLEDLVCSLCDTIRKGGNGEFWRCVHCEYDNAIDNFPKCQLCLKTET